MAATGESTDQTGIKVSTFKGAFNTAQTMSSPTRRSSDLVIGNAGTVLHTRIRSEKVVAGSLVSGKESYSDQVEDNSHDAELMAATGESTDQTGIKVSTFKGAFNTAQTMLSLAWQLTNVVLGNQATILHTRIRSEKVVAGSLVSGKE